MKEAIVEYASQRKEHKALILSNEQDLEELDKALEIAIDRVTVKGLRSDCPLDHMSGNFTGLESLLFKSAEVIASCNELKTTIDGKYRISNPFYLLTEASNLYRNSIKKAIESKEKVILKSEGGWCTECEEVRIKQIIGDGKFNFKQRKLIRRKHEHANYIIIENDVALEKEAEKYLRSKGNYSYICELRILTEKELTEDFKTFVENGGKTLYVYTTGLDIDQAYMYSRCAVEAGIKKFEFQLSAEKSKEFSKFMESLINQGLDVKEIK